MKATKKAPATKQPTETVEEYRTISLHRPDRAYIEIGYYNGKITSFYESYPGMGGHNLEGYTGADVNSTVEQLLACEWKI